VVGTALGVRSGIGGACAGAHPHNATSKTSTQTINGSRTVIGSKLLTVIPEVHAAAWGTREDRNAPAPPLQLYTRRAPFAAGVSCVTISHFPEEKSRADHTAELIAAMGVLSNPQVSPDGSLAVYGLAPMGRKAEHPASALWIAPVDGSAAPRQFMRSAARRSYS